jgi:hypothetical protein
MPSFTLSVVLGKGLDGRLGKLFDALMCPFETCGANKDHL